MKRILLVLIGFMLAASAVNGQCLRTGFRSDTTSTADTVLFYDNQTMGDGMTYRFPASTVYIKLDVDANGTVCIRRLQQVTGSELTVFIDDTLAVRLTAGKYFLSKDKDIVGFAFYKETGHDKLIYSASRCDESYMSSDEVTDLPLFSFPDTILADFPDTIMSQIVSPETLLVKETAPFALPDTVLTKETVPFSLPDTVLTRETMFPDTFLVKETMPVDTLYVRPVPDTLFVREAIWPDTFTVKLPDTVLVRETAFPDTFLVRETVWPDTFTTLIADTVIVKEASPVTFPDTIYVRQVPDILSGGYYTLSNDTINAGADSLYFGFALANGTIGCWYAVHASLEPDAAAHAVIRYFYQGVLVKKEILWPNWTIFEPFRVDSIFVIKADADTVSIGGQR